MLALHPRNTPSYSRGSRAVARVPQAVVKPDIWSKPVKPTATTTQAVDLSVFSPAPYGAHPDSASVRRAPPPPSLPY